MRPTIMTSCDRVYLREHAGALMLSSVLSGNDFHLHCIEGGDDEDAYMFWLRDRCRELASEYHQQAPVITLSSGIIKQKEMGGEKRVYYACDRFLTAAEMFKWTDTWNDEALPQSLVIVDTDCMVLKAFPEPIESLGLFFRESLPGTTGWEAAGTKIAAGLVYVKRNLIGIMFLNEVCQLLNAGPAQWFLDQVSLSAAAAPFHHSEKFAFGPDVLDWEFKPDTVIWTGKGDRKYTNQTYLARKAMFIGMLDA